MQRKARWLVTVVMVAALALGACAKSDDGDEEANPPAKVEEIAGTNQFRVVLVDEAAERIGIETAPVRALDGGEGAPSRTVVSYGSIVYDADGVTSVYTNPEQLVFVRKAITVDHIQGNDVVLSDGPPVGTQVVTVGAEELLGAETGIGEFE